MAAAKRKSSKRNNVTKLQTAEKQQRPILRTEKDGRLYAIALLAEMEKQAEAAEERDGTSAYSALAEGSLDRQMLIYRTAPQMDTLAKWTGDLYKRGTQAAINGFHVVLTDFLSTVIEGAVPDADYYRELEGAGRLAPWGSVIYANPEAARKAIANGEFHYEANRETLDAGAH